MRTLATMTALLAATSACSVNTLAIGAGGTQGETVTIGTAKPVVFELSYDGILTAPTNVRVDISASGGTAGAKAARVLTSTANFADGETVTIGTSVYTFKTAAAAPYQINVGADLATSLVSLRDAINATTNAAVFPGTAAHPDVVAVATGTTLTATAKNAGTYANTIATTETGANTSWAGATLTGGTQATVTAAGLRSALVTAIGGTQYGAVLNGNNVLVYDEAPGDHRHACTETLAGSGNAWVAAAMFGGSGPTAGLTVSQTRVATAAEATAGVMVFAFPAVPLAATVTIRSAAGVSKLYDGDVIISGQSVAIGEEGSTDFANTDVVTVQVAFAFPDNP